MFGKQICRSKNWLFNTPGKIHVTLQTNLARYILIKRSVQMKGVSHKEKEFLETFLILIFLS